MMYSRDKICVPGLSEEAELALQQFIEERGVIDDSYSGEDWHLSQFWYHKDTIAELSKAAVRHSTAEDSKIALVCCPSLYKGIKKEIEEKKEKKKEVKVFDIDRRFVFLRDDFIFYDYREPLNLNPNLKGSFDLIFCDPPYLAEECITKVLETVDYLRKEDSKIILCTGAIMERYAAGKCDLKMCTYEPRHTNKLANDFICMTNFGEPVE